MKKLHVAVLVFLLGAGAAPFSSARATILPLHLSPLLVRATTPDGDLVQRVQANPADKAKTAPPAPCRQGYQRNARGECVAANQPVRPCSPGQQRNERGECVAVNHPAPQPCREGQQRDARGECVAVNHPAPPPCREGQQRDARGACVAAYPPAPPPCREGYQKDARGECVAAYHPPPMVPKTPALPTVIATPYIEPMKPAYLEPKNAALPTVIATPYVEPMKPANVEPKNVALPTVIATPYVEPPVERSPVGGPPAAQPPPPNVSCDANSSCGSSGNNLSDKQIPKASGLAVGSACKVDSDCSSEACHPTTHLCMVSHAAER
jgi:hypothetical protein